MSEFSTPSSPTELEACKVYTALFARPIPPILVERFGAASERLNRTVPPPELARYYTAIAACDDLEALEVAARYTGRSKLLTRKFRLMAYLGETLPENQTVFVNASSSLLAGLWQSFTGVVRTVFKLLKGLWLLKRVAYV